MSEFTVCVRDLDGDGNCQSCASNPEAGCRMSPRDAVHWLFRNGLTDYRLEIFLNAYAHELAEKQRAWAADFGDTPTQQAIRSVVNEAADLIDIGPHAHLELEGLGCPPGCTSPFCACPGTD